MQAKFIIPSWSYWTEPLRAQPLTQLYLATILEDTFPQDKIDLVDLRDGQKKISESDIFFYTVASPDFKEVSGIVERLKQQFPNAKHVAGGPHPTLFPEESLKIFDAIAVGKGENSIVDMVEDYKQDKMHKIYDTPIRKGQVFPYPRREFLRESKIVTNLFKTEDVPSTTAQFSFGCVFDCSFCANYNRGAITTRTLQQISDEIDYLKDTYGIEGLSLQDEICIPQAKESALEWLALMESKKIKWRGQIRAIEDEEIIKRAKQSGCDELSFGLESVDATVLDMTNKKMSAEKVKKTIELCRKYDIKTRVYLINGLPGEGEDIVKKTKDFINQTNPDIVLLSSLQPYPGSPIAEHPERYGIAWINTDYTKYNHLKCRFGDDETIDDVVPFAYKNGLSRQQIYSNLLELQGFLRERGVNK